LEIIQLRSLCEDEVICEELGYHSIVKMPENPENELLEKLIFITIIPGFCFSSAFFREFERAYGIDSVDYRKDVDGLHPVNGAFATG
jgi:5,10-methylene-tetrahydrofolate dehydrogenase/methenyl tetrahydrofolate cyclohydrolase